MEQLTPDLQWPTKLIGRGRLSPAMMSLRRLHLPAVSAKYAVVKCALPHGCVGLRHFEFHWPWPIQTIVNKRNRKGCRRRSYIGEYKCARKRQHVGKGTWWAQHCCSKVEVRICCKEQGPSQVQRQWKPGEEVGQQKDESEKGDGKQQQHHNAHKCGSKRRQDTARRMKSGLQPFADWRLGAGALVGTSLFQAEQKLYFLHTFSACRKGAPPASFSPSCPAG